MARARVKHEFYPFSAAFLISVVLHLLSILLITGLYAFDVIHFAAEPPPEAEGPAEEIMKFTFVDLPAELPEPEAPPETERYSDRDRVASGPPSPVPEESESEMPYNEGETDILALVEPDPGEDLNDIPVEEAVPDIAETMDLPREPPAAEETEAPEAPAEEGRAYTPEDRRRLQESIESSMESYQPPENTGIDQPRYDNRESSLFTEDSILSFETKWFDWGPYAKELYWIIRRNWRIPMAARWPLLMKGRAVVRFTLKKDGTVESVELLSDSGIPSFDDAAIYAIKLSDPFPPMPEEFPGEKERITCSFYYNIRMGDAY
jgi:TonB family protein